MAARGVEKRGAIAIPLFHSRKRVYWIINKAHPYSCMEIDLVMSSNVCSATWENYEYFHKAFFAGGYSEARRPEAHSKRKTSGRNRMRRPVLNLISRRAREHLSVWWRSPKLVALLVFSNHTNEERSFADLNIPHPMAFSLNVCADTRDHFFRGFQSS